jgi:hypothetical protein
VEKVEREARAERKVEGPTTAKPAALGKGLALGETPLKGSPPLIIEALKKSKAETLKESSSSEDEALNSPGPRMMTGSGAARTLQACVITVGVVRVKQPKDDVGI